MLLRTPDYFDRFHCIADKCPRNCCVGWEVVVDDDTAAYFAGVPGPFGDRLRAGLTADGEGERCFVRQNRRCPFLDGRNLCEIYQVLGEEHTSRTCRLHPRFTEDYGCVRETSLSASCPVAADLLLGSEEKLTFPATGELEAGERWTDAWEPLLFACRARALAILQTRSLPIRTRFTWFLLFSNEVQSALDEEQTEGLQDLCEAYGDLPEELPALELTGPGLFPAALKTLERLEILEEDWLPLLRAAEAAPRRKLPDWMLERMAAYFVFRDFCKAVRDGDLLSRAEFAVLAPLCVEHLSAAGIAPQETLYRFCREIEHDPDNLAALQTAFCEDPALGLRAFFWQLAND